MTMPPAWFANAMANAIRKDSAILFAKGLEPEDRALLRWALDQTDKLESAEERAKCRDRLSLMGQLSTDKV